MPHKAAAGSEIVAGLPFLYPATSRDSTALRPLPTPPLTNVFERIYYYYLQSQGPLARSKIKQPAQAVVIIGCRKYPGDSPTHRFPGIPSPLSRQGRPKPAKRTDLNGNRRKIKKTGLPAPAGGDRMTLSQIRSRVNTLQRRYALALSVVRARRVCRTALQPVGQGSFRRQVPARPLPGRPEGEGSRHPQRCLHWTALATYRHAPTVTSAPTPATSLTPCSPAPLRPASFAKPCAGTQRPDMLFNLLPGWVQADGG